jgi:hypothetical protein
MKSFFQYRQLNELEVGDVFKRTAKGSFYTVITKNEAGLGIQTTFGNLVTYQIHFSKMNEEVLFFPDRHRDIKKKIENRGGARSGSGAKSKYGEPTVNLTIRVPESKKDDVRSLVASYLEQFVVVKNEYNVLTKAAFDSLMNGGTVVLKFGEGIRANGDFTFSHNGQKVICSATQISPKRISLKAKQ